MQHLILIAFAFWILLTPFVLRHVPRDSRKSLSEHIATTKMTILVGRLAISLTALAVLFWYLFWYATLHSNDTQQFLVVAVCVSAMLLANTPYHKGTTAGRLHDIFAWTYAVLLLPLVITFVVTSDSIFAKVLMTILLTWQVIAFGLFLFHKPTRKHFLYYQLSYISAFVFVLLVATYVNLVGA